ncbi:beta-lactamase/transpeptidase-like protein [Irpex lacteus]|nr:beta-lactamase/transpeptidase-like protein [Irpex lacteus]
MYILASHVVALYSGTSFEDFVRTRIWDPLNMTSSTYSLTEASKTGRLTEAWATNGRRIPNVFEQPGASFVAAGAGGVISSVEDLTKWIGALLNEGVNPITNKTVLPPSVFAAMTSGYIVTNPRPQKHIPGPLSSLTAYGLGWERTTYHGHELIIHGGSITGFSSYVAFSPSAKLGIAVLSNGDLVHAQELAIIDKIITDFLPASTLSPASQQPKLQTPFRQANHSDNLCFEATIDAVPIAEFAGTYSSAGYQDLTLCDPKASSTVTACEGVLDIFGKFDDLSTSNDTLYAVFDNIVTSHVRFRRLSNTTFHAQTTSLYPNGYGRDESAFELEVPAVAAGIVEFVFENDQLVGAGLNFGGDDLSMRIRVGGSIKETSEVWYEKV